MSPEAFPLATRLGLARSPPPEGRNQYRIKREQVHFEGLVYRLGGETFAN